MPSKRERSGGISSCRLGSLVVRLPALCDHGEQVELAIAEHEGNKTAAARSLGIARQTLHEELRRRKA